MKINTKYTISLLATAVSVASAFTAPASLTSQSTLDSSTQLSMGDTAMPSRKSKTKMSEAIPFLKCPPYLNGELAGDVGFDPLGLGKNTEVVFEMREAEIKHARLAMLAAAGWPLSELYDKQIASFFEISPLLDATDRAPSLLNGGLDKVIPEWWGFCLGLTAAIDIYGIQKARATDYTPGDAGKDSYFPGSLGFDPLGLYPLDKDGRRRMQLAEIKHGRVAMVAVVGYSVQEAFFKVGVVDETPFFFKPIF